MTDDKRVFLTGHIDVPADRLESVKEALTLHITLTRGEPGCISFDVAEDAGTPGRFNVSEVFEDEAAFEAHQTRTRASDWFRVTEGIPRDYAVSVGKSDGR